MGADASASVFTQPESMKPSTRPCRAFLLPFVLTAMATPAFSQNLDHGTADAYGLNVDVSALSVIGATVGPLPEVQITSPATGTNQDTLLTISESLVLAEIVAENGGDDALLVSASTDIDGLGLTGSASGSSTVNGLSIAVIPGVLFLDDLITITATTIASTSSSGGSYGSLDSTGSSTLQDLQIWIGGTAITLDANAGPNTMVDVSAGGIAGIQIVLNEQIETGDGVASSGMTTNALRVSLDAISFGGFNGISGEVIVGHSASAVTAVPEPNAALLVGAAGTVGLLRRRRMI